MTDAEIRTAWRRLKDPLGSVPRVLVLAVGLGGVGVYGGTWLREDWRLPFVLLVGAAAAWYAGRSLFVRSVAAKATEAEIRARLVEDGVAALQGSGLLLVRGMMWLGIGAWAWAGAAGLVTFILTSNLELTLFVAALGTLLGAGLFLDWLLVLPRVKKDLERLAEGDAERQS